MLFYKGYGYERPAAVHDWAWSYTFNRWAALVTFADGWHGFTYPLELPLCLRTDLGFPYRPW